ncbi:MAG TPA: thioredoxin domain-containing protein [Kofleriaceae bacterium]|nr:thioredoxin domain-containing protein [Kofleriaceae bacterium]
MRGALFVIAVVCAMTAVAHAQRGFDPATVYKVPRGHAPAEGPVDAPVTIVMWSDFACGYCNRVQATLDELSRLYPGQLRYVHRTLPLDEDFTLTAEAALAAGAQGKFKPMSDRIYAAGGRLDRTAVELIARELGLDMVRFRAELDAHTYAAQIAEDVKDATALGVTGTPAFFVNGRPVHGSQPLKVFADVVDEELSRASRIAGGYDALVAKGVASANAANETGHPEFELDPTKTYQVGLGLPGHQQGPDTALVTIVAWSDFQCPYCAKLAPVLAALRQKYGNDLRIVYRHLAMRGHRHAALAAEAAVAAAEQGKFWAFHDQIFANFGSLTRADLEQFAAAAGLDLPKFKSALDDRRYHDVVVAETAAGEALGIDGTPTMFIDGQPVIGTRDVATLAKIVDTHLAQARATVKAGIAAIDLYALFMASAIGVDRSDPSRIPSASAAHIAMRADDRSRAVAAACRRRDAARAIELSHGLVGDPRRRALLVCAAGGIDLP